MTTKAKRPRGGKPAIKVQEIKFNKKAIEAIKKRKKGLYKRWVKQPKRKGR